jgi:hypothetical protein
VKKKCAGNGYAVEIRAQTELDKRAKRHQGLLDEFFALPPAAAHYKAAEGNALGNLGLAYCDKTRGAPLAEAALRIFEALEDLNAGGWRSRRKNKEV